MQPNTLQTKPLLKSLGIDWENNAKDFAFLQIFTCYVSDAQMVALTKAAKYGWKVSKIVFNHGEPDCAIAMHANGCAAWMMPDGSIDRAKPGVRRAYLDRNWKEST